MTDSDLARQMRLNEGEHWQRMLKASSLVGSLVQVDKPLGSLVVHSAASRQLDPPVGEGWLAVGDAASRFDPLSSQGITKALRSAIFASYAIGDWLTQGDRRGLQRYRRYIAEEFRSYSKVRAQYYREEQRWPTSQFWRRRHGPASYRTMATNQART
jgi:flavin-dependent dehydrogenase